MVEVAATKYWVKWDEEKNSKITTRLNITRMFEELIRSRIVPDEVKVQLAQEMNNTAAKKFLHEHAISSEKKRSVGESVAEKAESELKEKRAKVVAGAKGRENDRQNLISTYVNRDPPLPTAQYEICLYLLSVAMVMCRLPFAFIANPYFRTFLKALRPGFEAKLGAGMDAFALAAVVRCDPVNGTIFAQRMR